MKTVSEFVPSYLGDLPIDGESILRYKGPMCLRANGLLAQGQGIVEAVLLPTFILRFSFCQEGGASTIATSDVEVDTATLELVTLKRTANVLIYSFLPSSFSRFPTADSSMKIVGRLHSPCLFPSHGLNDGDASLQRVRFHLINFCSFYGDQKLSHTTQNQKIIWQGRAGLPRHSDLGCSP